jgi:general secretion pathway protein F
MGINAREVRVPVYSYIALEDDRSPRNGTIVADTPRLARDALRARGLRVRRVVSQAGRGSSDSNARGVDGWRTSRRHAPRTLSFIRELSTLLAVGTPMLEAIDIIAKQHDGRFHATLLMLRDRIASGAGLADAMRDHPDVFDEFCVNITEVGESSGNLENVLERLADFRERAQALKDRVTAALIYPCIVLVMALAVSIFLMTLVVPKLLAGLIEARRQIPLVTRIVKACSDFLVNDWWLILAIAVAVFLAITAVLRSRAGRLRWHRLQLRIPIVGEMIRKQAMLRVAIVISTLMRSGIVFVRALQIAQRATSQLVIRNALSRCEAAVNGGREISQALADTGAFPPLVVQIFAVGQQSGRLEEMLERLAADYDRQLTAMSQRLTAVLEPILILFLVILVGFIAFATVLPMLEAANVF